MATTAQQNISAQEITHWMIDNIAETMKIERIEIDPRKTFEHYGMGSLDSVNLVSDLEEWLARPIDATLIWDYPTIESLAKYLASEQG